LICVQAADMDLIEGERDTTPLIQSMSEPGLKRRRP